MKEIFVYDLIRLELGSNVRVLWNNHHEELYEVRRTKEKGICLANDDLGYCQNVGFIQRFINRVWLVEHGEMAER